MTTVITFGNYSYTFKNIESLKSVYRGIVQQNNLSPIEGLLLAVLIVILLPIAIVFGIAAIILGVIIIAVAAMFLVTFAVPLAILMSPIFIAFAIARIIGII
jgi:hypothetical protein